MKKWEKKEPGLPNVHLWFQNSQASLFARNIFTSLQILWWCITKCWTFKWLLFCTYSSYVTIQVPSKIFVGHWPNPEGFLMVWCCSLENIAKFCLVWVFRVSSSFRSSSQMSWVSCPINRLYWSWTTDIKNRWVKLRLSRSVHMVLQIDIHIHIDVTEQWKILKTVSDSLCPYCFFIFALLLPFFNNSFWI